MAIGKTMGREKNLSSKENIQIIFRTKFGYLWGEKNSSPLK